MKLLLLFSSLLLCTQLMAKPLVVTTIRPMTMLVEAIAGDSVEIRQLLPDSEVPHHYSLRISDRALLAEADLLLWVGPELESFLSKSLTALRPEKVITAAALPDIRWLSPGIEGQATHSDPHIWMNPENARVIASEVGNWLAAHYPGQRGQLLDAQQRFNQQLKAVTANAAAQLETVRQENFIVDHDAFGHFAKAFGLHQSGALKSNVGLSSGARDFHRLLNQNDVRCIIAEPRHNHGRVTQLATKLDAKVAIIDPLGAGIALNNTAYTQLIGTIAEKISACLSPASTVARPTEG